MLANGGIPVVITKNIYDEFIVEYKYCEIVNGNTYISVYGTGKTVEEAAKKYIKEISGKTVCFNHNTKEKYVVLNLGDQNGKRNPRL